jgi:hypothetical protein
MKVKRSVNSMGAMGTEVRNSMKARSKVRMGFGGRAKG